VSALELITDVRATPEVCFDLSRDLDLHRRSMAGTREEAVGGRTSGLIELGEEVTWRGRHLGFWHHHTARITRFDRPRHFRDEMVRGRFASFVHDHHFEATESGTRIRETLEFRSPLGWLGRLVDRFVLEGYLRRLLEARNEVIRAEAEANAEPASE
jgi:ligand-binding SRPBCC domain-containing protein